MIDPAHYGIVEMVFTGAVVLGFSFYQLWTVRDAGKPRPPSEEPPRHPEG